VTGIVVLALIATIVLETIAASLLLRRFVWVHSLAIQLMTWPVAQKLVENGARLWIVELGVFLAEIVLWRFVLPMTWRRATLVSLVANGITAAIAFGMAGLQ
jgi:hypothetical protein